MVEGGPTVAASFVAADLVDEAALVRCDKTIGEGIAPLQGMSLDALTRHLQAAGSERLGPDTLESYARANQHNFRSFPRKRGRSHNQRRCDKDLDSRLRGNERAWIRRATFRSARASGGPGPQSTAFDNELDPAGACPR